MYLFYVLYLIIPIFIPFVGLTLRFIASPFVVCGTHVPWDFICRNSLKSGFKVYFSG